MNVDPTLLQDILSSSSGLSIPIDNKEAFTIFESIPLPNLNKEQISQFVLDYKNGVSLSSIICSPSISFPYNFELLSIVMKSSITDKRSKRDFYASSVFYMFLAWIASYSNMVKPHSFLPLLIALENFLHNSSFSYISQRCFIIICRLFFKTDKKYFVYAIQDIFIKFISEVQVPSLIIQSLQGIASNNHIYFQEPRFKQFLQQISVAISTKESYFHGDLQAKLIDLFRMLIFQLEPNSIQLFATACNPLDDSAAKLVIPYLPDSFLTQIIQINVDSLPFRFPLNETYKYFIANPSAIQDSKYEGVHYFSLHKSPYNLGFSGIETFPKGFDPSFSVSFPPLLQLDQFLGENLQRNIPLIVHLLLSNPNQVDSFLEKFFDLINGNVKDPMFTGLYCSLLHFYYLIQKAKNFDFSSPSEIANQFFQTRIFSPIVTVFNSEPTDEKWAFINTFRELEIEFCLSDYGDTIEKILRSDMISFPDLLSELFYRLIGQLPNLIKKIETNPRIIDALTDVGQLYQKLDIDYHGISEAITRARSAYFSLLAHLFSDVQTLFSFFSHPGFLTTFLSFLFEKNIRSFITGILALYFNSQDSNCIYPDNVSDPSELPQNLLKIIEVAAIQLPGQKQLQLLFDIVSLLNSSMSSRKTDKLISFLQLFKELCPSLCVSLNKIGNDSLSKQFYEEVLTFFTLMSDQFLLTNLNIDTLISVLNSFCDINFINHLKPRFIQLLAGECMPSLTPSFIVKQPHVLRIFLEIFSFSNSGVVSANSTSPSSTNSSTSSLQTLTRTSSFQLLSKEGFTNYLTFLHDLCQFSPHNIEACAAAELDLSLLEIIQNARVIEELSDEDVKLLLKLYRTFALQQTTTQSVLRFISLLAPTDSSHISKYTPLVLNELNQMAMAVKQEPLSYLVLGTNRIIFNNGPFPSSTGFSFSIWFLLEPSTQTNTQIGQSLHLCQITFLPGTPSTLSVGLFISSNMLIVELETFSQHSQGKIAENLSYNVWHYAIISLKINGHRTFISYMIDCGTPDIFSAPPIEFPPEAFSKPAQFSIGEGPDLIYSPEFTAKRRKHMPVIRKEKTFDSLKSELMNSHIRNISSRSMDDNIKLQTSLSSNLKSGSQDALCQNNVVKYPIKIAGCGVFPLLSVDEQYSLFEAGIRCTTLSIETKPYAFISKYFDDDINKKSNFVDVLVKQCKIETILPLFSLSGYKTKDGEVFAFPLELCIDILSSLLSYSEEAQISFAQSDGFIILGHLLTTQRSNLCTFKIYSQLTNILSILSYEPLQKQFFEGVLTNFSLLFNLDDETHLRIIRLWSQSLFQNFNNLSSTVFGFKGILSILRVYYWYSPKEVNIIENKDSRNPKFDIKKCRKQLFNILDKFIFNDFEAGRLGDVQFSALVGHSISCSDSGHVKELLEFILSIINRYEMKKVNPFFFSVLVHHFLNCSSTEFQILVIQIMVTANHKKVLTNENFTFILLSIIHLQPFLCTDINGLFSYLLTIINSEPLLLPLCCYIAKENFGNPDAVDNLLSKLVPKKEFISGEFWALWPLLLCLDCQPSQQKTILLFLLNCCEGSVLDLFLQFDIVFVPFPELGIPLEELLVPLLQDLSSTQPILNDFILIAQRLIFFQLSALIPCPFFYNKSNPFLECTSEYFSTQETLEQINIQDITKKVQSDRRLSTEQFDLFDRHFSVPNYKFTLHFDSNYNWYHQKLAKLCITLMNGHENLISEHFAFILMTCAYLVKTNPKEVSSILSSMAIFFNEQNKQKYQDIISLLNYNSEISNSSIHIDIGSTPFSTPMISFEKFNIILHQIYPIKYITEVQKKFSRFTEMISMTKSLSSRLVHPDFHDLIVESIETSKSFSQRQIDVDTKGSFEWRRLTKRLTTDRAPWDFSENSRPSKWKRDITACIGLAPFKMKKIRPRLTSLGKRSSVILSESVVIPSNNDISSSLLVPKSENEDGDYTLNCTLETIKGTHPASLIFKSDTILLLLDSTPRFQIKMNLLKYVLLRPPSSFQLITADGESFLINCDPEDPLNITIMIADMNPKTILLQKLDSLSFFATLPYKEQWVNGTLSTFEYILILNAISGRTFNSLDLYPVFPWLITEFSGEEISTSIRNFSFPITDVKSSTGKESRNFPMNREAVLTYLAEIEPFATIGSTTVKKQFSMDDFLFYCTNNHNSDIELTPEFFFEPDIFSNPNFALPFWATSPLDFIYKHRKLLESKEVSENIHKWFTKVWSFDSSKFAIFDGIHPKRNVYINPPPIFSVFEKQESLKMITSSLIISNFSSIIIYHLSCGCVFKSTFSFDSLSESGTKIPDLGTFKSNSPIRHRALSVASRSGMITQIHSNENSNITIMGSRKRPLFTSIRGAIPILQGFAVVDSSSVNLSIIDVVSYDEIQAKSNSNSLDEKLNSDTKKLKTLSFTNNIECIASDGPWIAIASDNSEIKLFYATEQSMVYLEERATIQLYKEKIVTCAVSSSFKAIVCGTRDSSLAICNLNGVITQMVELGKLKPKKVIITPSWGFIVTECEEVLCGEIQRHILIHTINGKFVKKLSINFEIQTWCCWSSYSGFDYIGIASGSGNIYISEVYYIDCSKSLYESHSAIIGINYSKNGSMLVLVTEEGKVVFIPYIIN